MNRIGYLIEGETNGEMREEVGGGYYEEKVE